MDRHENDDRDAQAAWELLGRHRGIEPSTGFVDRTMRGLRETPKRVRWWQLPVLRWGLAGGLAVVALAGVLTYRHVEQRRQAELYAAAHQDTLEDFDVIAALDQLNGDQRL